MTLLEVSPHVDTTVGDVVLVARDEHGVDHELTGNGRAVFEFVAQGMSTHDAIAALARDPFVGPLRASDVYDATVAELLQRRLLVARRESSPFQVFARRAPRRVYPWYDSPWLGKWMGTRDLVDRERPELADEFVALAEPLRTDAGFTTNVLGAVADEKLLAQMRLVISELDPATVEIHEGDAFGRALLHNHPFFNELHQEFVGLASEAAGEELEASYNFLSLYTSRGVCAPHMDAPSAKYTLDLCIDQSDPWPIHISQVVPWPEDWDYEGTDWAERIKDDPALRYESYVLEPGQAIFFAGSSQWHYRDPYPTSADGCCNLIFFHFIPKGTRDFVRLFDPYLT